LNKTLRTAFVLIIACLGACQVAAPKASFQGPQALIRSDIPAEAEEISGVYEKLRLAVDALLPGSETRAREVWIQAEPALYHFNQDSYAEADGFWSENLARIHLRRNSHSLRRTLAHELVHASLEGAWSTLPGTIEEGLCDVVSVMLCPEDATNMRTGRLSAAAFALGGLELEIKLSLGSIGSGGLLMGGTSRMRLQADMAPSLDPLDVFSVEAGLSTTHMPVNDKKALYGLSFLLVERIILRHGLGGFYSLCLKAEAKGLEKVPGDWLLEAAGLQQPSLACWRQALQQAVGEEELEMLVDLYPSLLTSTASKFMGQPTRRQLNGNQKGTILASIRVAGAETMLDMRLELAPHASPVESSYNRE
jgi:hypothetical protein